MLRHGGLRETELNDDVASYAGLSSVEYLQDSKPSGVGNGLRHHGQIEVVGRLRGKHDLIHGTALFDVHRSVDLPRCHISTITEGRATWRDETVASAIAELLK